MQMLWCVTLPQIFEYGFNAVHQSVQCSIKNINHFLEVATNFVPLTHVIRLQRLQQLLFVGRY
jgi:hypothetical protein